MAKEKKPFKETGFGKFVNKAKDLLPDVGGVIVKAATGNISGAIEEVTDMLKGNQEKKEEAAKALQELSIHRLQWEKEMRDFDIQELQVHAADRDSARQREVALAQAGKKDIMMTVVGGAVIAITTVVIFIVMFKSLDDFQQKIAIHVLGIIEGAFISMVTYYFGSSKGSKDKQEKIDRMIP